MSVYSVGLLKILFLILNNYENNIYFEKGVISVFAISVRYQNCSIKICNLDRKSVV